MRGNSTASSTSPSSSAPAYRAAVSRRLVLLGERFRSAAALLVDHSLGLRNPAQLRARDPASAAAAWLRAEYEDEVGGRWSELDVGALVRDAAFLAVGNLGDNHASVPHSFSPSRRSCRFADAENGVFHDRIVLGQAAVFTEPAAQLGIQMRNGIQAYLDYVNAKGSVQPRGSISSPRTTATSRR